MSKILEHKSRKRGFTLIELLVVIAIIAILAAILFPVFARARENARRASCQNNLKQIGLGILQYTQDYDEKYPMAWNGYWNDLRFPNADGTPGHINGAYTMVESLQPYLKSRQIWKCPSGPRSGNGSGRALDYGYNYSLLGADFGNPPPSPPGNPSQYAYAANASAIKETARTLMMTEIMWAVLDNPGPSWMSWAAGGNNKDITKWYEWSGGRNISGAVPSLDLRQQQVGGPTRSWSMPGDWTNGAAPAPRHLGVTNVLYCDGHVKIMHIEDMLDHPCGDPQCIYCNGN